MAAYLLKKRGFEVAGVFIETWHPEGFPCTEKEERRDAMRVAAHLDIPLYVVDAVKQYKKYVADEMIREYKRGRTPNPDILCNKFVKFETLFLAARKLAADFVATGHYARVKIIDDGLYGGTAAHSPDLPSPRSRRTPIRPKVILSEPKDKEKDQTYFLWAVPPDKLEQIIFPLENLTKLEVRQIAKRAGIPVADKKDSQGICFLGPLDLKKYLQINIKSKRGEVKDEDGKVIGTHNGVWFYTEGERHGFSVRQKSVKSRPFYILKKDVKKNVLIVGPEKDLARRYTIKLTHQNFHSNVLTNVRMDCEARFRYRQKKQKVRLFKKPKSTKGGSAEWSVSVKSPTPIALGQSVVFYKDENVVGGAVLNEFLNFKIT